MLLLTRDRNRSKLVNTVTTHLMTRHANRPHPARVGARFAGHAKVTRTHTLLLTRPAACCRKFGSGLSRKFAVGLG
jgi:hypothetical protein